MGFQKAEGKAQIGIQAREEPGGSRQQGQAGRLRRERTMAEEDENEGIEAIEQRQKKEPEQQMGQYQGSHAAGKMQGDAESLVTHFRQELEAAEDKGAAQGKVGQRRVGDLTQVQHPVPDDFGMVLQEKTADGQPKPDHEGQISRAQQGHARAGLEKFLEKDASQQKYHPATSCRYSR